MIVYGAVFPHPPMIIPQIGGSQIGAVSSTVAGMKELAAQVAAQAPDLLIFTTPHGNIYRDAISVLASPKLEGDFGSFGHGELRYGSSNDKEFLARLTVRAGEKGIVIVPVDNRAEDHRLNPRLDHGILVPLHYLQEAGLGQTPLLAVSIGMLAIEELYLLGMLIRETAEELGRRAALIASGDMSHRLKDDGPYSYHPDGPRFDQEVVASLKSGDVVRLVEIPAELRDNAGECGFRSLVILMGSLDGNRISPRVYSYEGPFGVGYLTAGIEPLAGGNELYPELLHRKKERHEKTRRAESTLVQWARKCLETYVRSGERVQVPSPVPKELDRQAATFVSLKKGGQLRGCIGTLEPVWPDLAIEIRENAISSGTKDSRFSPVEADELEDLVYSVDVLGAAEPIDGINELDPSRYGVIVSSGARSGVLLPDLEGVDTPQQQVEIARQKAGIKPHEKIRLQRFEVTRYK